MNIKIFLLILIPFIGSCNAGNEGVESKKAKAGYILSQPDSIFILPSSLNEISGISFVDKNRLACINDEEGIIYIYDLRQKSIVRKMDFAKNNDYEDIAVVGKSIFVINSGGSIFEIKSLNESDYSINRYKNFLTKDNNTEGLCYDKENNRLLIACKNQPYELGGKSWTKAIYSFDLAKQILLPDPVILLDVKKIKEKLRESALADMVEEMLENISPGKGQYTFHPSGLAIHPKTKDLFIISSKGKALVITDMDGNLKNAFPLPLSVFRQPEGIAFDTEGNLYISNEAVGTNSDILYFKYLD